jgi:hypothetical protein
MDAGSLFGYWWILPLLALFIGYKLVLRIFGVVIIPQDSIGVVNKKFVVVGRNRSLPDGSIIALHGEAGTWKAARVVAIDVDAASGLPKASTTLVSEAGGLREFASGWDDNTRSHGRPAAVAFADDGRLFIGNDNDGSIFWIAPLDLKR